ncbi:NAD(P)H-hydrate dehydratase [Escherichia coli]
MLTGKTRDVTGQLHFDSLGLGRFAGRSDKIQRFSAEQLSHWLKPRRPTSHKGDHGRLVIIGGDHGTAGAIRMTGEAALRAGAGLVRVLTRSENIAPLLTARPELMVHELTINYLYRKPGMGRCGGDWSRSGPARVGEKSTAKS